LKLTNKLTADGSDFFNNLKFVSKKTFKGNRGGLYTGKKHHFLYRKEGGVKRKHVP